MSEKGYILGSTLLLQSPINTDFFKIRIIFGYGYKIVYTDYTKNQLTRCVFVVYNIGAR